MKEIDKILHNLGYLDCDPHKRAEIQQHIEAAEQFMRDAGVPDENLTAPTAVTVKSIWADYCDKGEYEKLIRKDSILTALISQLKR